MNIELAKSAGFCFGVQRAIKMIYDALDQNKKICTLGNIIHNKNMINELACKGVKVIENINDAKNDETIVIRSHGVSNDVFAQLSKKNFLNGTCPFVSKIHNIVSSEFINNKTGEKIDNNLIFVIIIGDENHPEIKGIEGHCIYNFKTIANSNTLNEYLKNNHHLTNKNIKVVTQTTYNPLELEKCVEIIKANFINYEIFDTICNETKKRQIEAANMSKKKDLMLIIGDRNSSNTQKLVSVCKPNCTTYLIETALDLTKYDFSIYKNVGITAGASTPSNIIMDVINKLNNQNKIQNINHVMLKDKEINFE